MNVFKQVINKMDCHVPAHAAFISIYNLILKDRASYTFMYMFIWKWLIAIVLPDIPPYMFCCVFIFILYNCPTCYCNMWFEP